MRFLLHRLRRTGGTFALLGTLINSNTTLHLDGTLGLWQLNGAIIQGGSITGSNTMVVVANSTLDGVTLNVPTSVQPAYDGGNCYSMALTVSNGLTLNSVLTLQRNDIYRSSAILSFAGTQTLAGNGQVVFSDPGYNWSCTGEYLQPSSGTLTIGPDITIHGQRGYVGNPSLPLINRGTILSDAGQTITVQANALTNLGTILGSGGSLLLSGLADPRAVSVAGGNLTLNGAWTNSGPHDTRDNTDRSEDIFAKTFRSAGDVEVPQCGPPEAIGSLVPGKGSFRLQLRFSIRAHGGCYFIFPSGCHRRVSVD